MQVEPLQQLIAMPWRKPLPASVAFAHMAPLFDVHRQPSLGTRRQVYAPFLWDLGPAIVVSTQHALLLRAQLAPIDRERRTGGQQQQHNHAA